MAGSIRDHIRFLANLGEGRRTFEGTVEGNRMLPLTSAAGWHAERAR